MLLWVILATFGRISGSCMASVVQKRLYLAGESSTAIVAISMTTVAGIAVCLSSPQIAELVALPTAFWGCMVLSSLLDTVGNVLLVRSVGAGDLSIVGPLNSYKPLIATLLGALLFHEIPSIIGIFGMLSIFAGSLWLLRNGDARGGAKSSNARHAIAIRIGSIVFTSVASLFLKSAIEFSNPWLSFQSWAVFSAALAWLVIALRVSPSQRRYLGHADSNKRRTKVSLGIDYLLLGISLFIMQGLTIWLFARMPVGYALALFQFASLIQVGLGIKLFSEQHTTQRLAAATVMTVGAIVVLLSPHA